MLKNMDAGNWIYNNGNPANWAPSNYYNTELSFITSYQYNKVYTIKSSYFNNNLIYYR